MKKSISWSVIQNKATEIGFAEVAAVPLSDLQYEADNLEEWLAAGHAGDMDYMHRTKNVRKDPKLFLDNAQSVIVGAIDYYQEYPEASENETAGKIARYAVGRDYHKVIKKMLIQLVDFLQQQLPDTEKEDYRISLDAHPVLERAWADKAQLGFLGKNSCLITRKNGSWVLLGAIFTTQEIDSIVEKKERKISNTQFPISKNKKGELNFSQLSCGSCTRCIDYCPTKAIIAPGKIDARRCISYLTIENKEGIPEEFRTAMGDRLFGCDICQEVCPFNIPRQQKSTSPLMEKQIAGTEVLIAEILQIATDEEFLERFAGSPLMRAKRRGLLRNACVVAGNSGNQDLIPLLQEVCEREDDPMLQEHAEWAITQLQKEVGAPV